MVTTPTKIDAARIPKNPPSHTAASRVARGAALLDERRPGWWLAVVPRRLDMQMGGGNHGRCCVLAQLYGYYGAGIVALGLLVPECVNHGFDADPETPYTELTRLWRREIAARSMLGAA